MLSDAPSVSAAQQRPRPTQTLRVKGLGGVGMRLFRNHGRSQFSELTDSGPVSRYSGMSVALTDVDSNNTLDL